MKQLKKIFFLVALVLAILIGIPNIASATNESTVIGIPEGTGHIRVAGQIGETATEKPREREKEGDKKITIVADGSQLGKRKLPKTGSSSTQSLMILGYSILLFLLLVLLRRNKAEE